MHSKAVVCSFKLKKPPVAKAEFTINSFCKRIGFGFPVEPDVFTITKSSLLNQSVKKLVIDIELFSVKEINAASEENDAPFNLKSL